MASLFAVTSVSVAATQISPEMMFSYAATGTVCGLMLLLICCCLIHGRSFVPPAPSTPGA